VLEAFREWWSALGRREKQALLVLGVILLGILVFLAGTAVGEAIGRVLF
jgi:type II secretory pathway component PulM